MSELKFKLKRINAELKMLKVQKKGITDSLNEITDPFEKTMATRMQNIYLESHAKNEKMLKDKKVEVLEEIKIYKKI